MSKLSKSKEMGILYEKLGMEYLNSLYGKVKFVDKFYDCVVNNNIIVEIKGCYYNKNGKRKLNKASFLLHKEQHEKLLKINGYYLFVLKNGDVRFNLIHSKFINLNKKSYFYVKEIFENV